jgi:ribokinase
LGRVIVFGSLSQDLHLAVERHPRSGETLMSGDIEYRFGGKGANQAVAAALAGAPSMFIGKVGDDPQGHEYVDRLGRFGVDTSRMAVESDRPTGTAIIFVDPAGENMIVVAPGANRAMSMTDLARLGDVDSGDVLLMPLELPHDVVAAAARQAHERGARVILNLAPYAPLPQDVLQMADPLVVNEHEEVLMRRSGYTDRNVLVTMGSRGSRWDEAVVQAERATAVDTTGAGDAYCGTLAAHLCRGADRVTAMRAASAAAARNVEHDGAQPALTMPAGRSAPECAAP